LLEEVATAGNENLTRFKRHYCMRNRRGVSEVCMVAWVIHKCVAYYKHGREGLRPHQGKEEEGAQLTY
jgi:hypothetical protein